MEGQIETIKTLPLSTQAMFSFITTKSFANFLRKIFLLGSDQTNQATVQSLYNAMVGIHRNGQCYKLTVL